MLCRRTLAILVIAASTEVAPAQEPGKLADATPYLTLAKGFKVAAAKTSYYRADGANVAILANSHVILIDLDSGKETPAGVVAILPVEKVILPALPRPVISDKKIRPILSPDGALFVNSADKIVALWDLNGGK